VGAALGVMVKRFVRSQSLGGRKEGKNWERDQRSIGGQGNKETICTSKEYKCELERFRKRAILGHREKRRKSVRGESVQIWGFVNLDAKGRSTREGPGLRLRRHHCQSSSRINYKGLSYKIEKRKLGMLYNRTRPQLDSRYRDNIRLNPAFMRGGSDRTRG